MEKDKSISRVSKVLISLPFMPTILPPAVCLRRPVCWTRAKNPIFPNSSLKCKASAEDGSSNIFTFFKCQGQRRFELWETSQCPAPGLTTTAPRCPGPRPRSGPGRRTRGFPGRSRSYATSYTVGCTQTISRKKNEWRATPQILHVGYKRCQSLLLHDLLSPQQGKKSASFFLQHCKNISPS